MNAALEPFFSQILSSYSPIALEEMNSVKLLNRMDTKFVFSIEKLPLVLDRMKESYRVLETNPARFSDYRSLYFDTEAFDFYHTHHRGKAGRYKIRFRHYTDTDLFYLEVKYKNNKGRTIKSRKRKEMIEEQLSEKSIRFLTENININLQALRPKLWVEFSRLTFVNNEMTERATMDFNLRFSYGDKELRFPEIAIAEIKQDKFSVKSAAISALRAEKIREGNMSKYSIGAALMFTELKQNNFKEKILTIHKLQKNGIFRD